MRYFRLLRLWCRLLISLLRFKFYHLTIRADSWLRIFFFFCFALNGNLPSVQTIKHKIYQSILSPFYGNRYTNLWFVCFLSILDKRYKATNDILNNSQGNDTKEILSWRWWCAVHIYIAISVIVTLVLYVWCVVFLSFFCTELSIKFYIRPKGKVTKLKTIKVAVKRKLKFNSNAFKLLVYCDSLVIS